MTQKNGNASWLWKQFRPFWGVQAARLSLIFLWSCLVVLDPLILKWIIDDIVLWGSLGTLIPAVLAFFAVFFFRFVIEGFGRVIDSFVSQRISMNLRMKLLRQYQGLSARYHDESRPGDEIHRIQDDVEKIGQFSGALLGASVRSVTDTVFTLTVMLILSWKLTLLLLPTLPFFFLIRRVGYPRLRSAAEDSQAHAAKRTCVLHENFTGMVQLQLLGGLAKERLRFWRSERTILGSRLRLHATDAALQSSSSLVTVAGMALVLGFGGAGVIASTFTVGSLVALYTFFDRLFEPIEYLVDMYSRYQKVQVSIRRIREKLDVEPVPSSTGAELPLAQDADCRIEFADIDFSYTEDNKVLDRLNLVVEPGSKIALIGASGCGKSTLVQILLRLYEADAGRVLIDGIDHRKYRLKDLRSVVTLVPQEPCLFDMSLRENLLYGDPQADDETLRRVLEISQMTSVVGEFADDLDEQLGPAAKRLSGGQRQRLAIARALLRRPRVLVLDEATSALDRDTEERLLTALDREIPDVTKILIAHRLSAIRWADQVFIVDQGVFERQDHPAGDVSRDMSSGAAAPDTARTAEAVPA